MSSGLIERNKVRTRRELAEAAARLFAERGYASTTVSDIAAAADVSPRTFFRYFPCKDDVVTAIASTGMDHVIDALERLSHDLPLGEAVRQALRTTLEPVRDTSEQTRAFQMLLRETPALRARWLEEQRRGRDRLSEALRPWFPANSPPMVRRLTAGSILLAVDEAMDAWTDDRAARDPMVLVGQALELLDRPVLRERMA